MGSPRTPLVAVIILSIVAMVGCTENALRTFTVLRDQGGIPVACEAFGLADPVRGTLRGDAAKREPIWLDTADGRHLSVVWPEGFSVRFEPMAALYDPNGRWRASDGSSVELGQVRWDSADGTYEDPYYATGILFDGCYLRVK